MTLPNYLVLDIENDCHNTGEFSVGGFAGSPFHPDNKKVMVGWMVRGSNIITNPAISLKQQLNYEPYKYLIGHNIKHDLLMLLCHGYWKNSSDGAVTAMLNYLLPYNTTLWDTQQAHYLLTGQEAKSISLNELAEHYGLPLKPDKIKQYWEEGYQTSDIPAEELEEYLKHDVDVTNEIFKKQYQEIVDAGMLQLMESQGDAILATTIMEYNGCHIDREVINNGEEQLSIIEQTLSEELSTIVNNQLGWPSHLIEFNPNSNDHVKTLIAGGILKYSDREYVLNEDGSIYHYKSGQKKGQPKTKKCIKTIEMPSIRQVDSVSVEVLEQIADTTYQSFPTTSIQSFCKKLLEYRGVQKQLSTYFKGYQKHIWHDEKIRPRLNHAITDTGRLSCSSPNLQNVSRSKE